MTNQLSGVAIIICIAFGFTTFVLIFIFGKRQIMRFALKSRRGPHVPIAADAPKYLRKEIDRRLEVVKDIKLEPRLINENTTSQESNNPDCSELDHVYRMKAVDDLKSLERVLLVSRSNTEGRPSGQDLRFYLLRMAREGNPLNGCDSSIITEYVDMYSHARHEATPVFTESEFKRYKEALNQLIDHVRKNNTTCSRRKESPKSQSAKSTSVALNGNTTVRILTPNPEELDESSV